MARRHLFIPLIALALATTPAVAETRHGTPLEKLRVTTTEVASGLTNPTSIVNLPDGRLWITEKLGYIRSYHPDTGLAPAPVLDFTDRVDGASAERGLLGLALAPDFRYSKTIYVAYTRKEDGAVTLSRVRMPSGGEQVLLTQEHAEFWNHNGGHLTFGPDGYLYFGIGDGGAGGDPYGSGQRLDTWLGKLLRIDVSKACGATPYCVPPGNPFADEPGALPEIWAWGLRNPWKFSFDRGSLWIADVGQGRFEEIDHVPARAAGVNYGWSCKEGPVTFDETRCLPDEPLTDPVFHYRSGTDGCAVIGGFVYRGRKYAHLAAGTYIAADFCSKTAWGVRAGYGGRHTGANIGAFPEYPTAFGVDNHGELYVSTQDPGKLYKVGFTRV